MYNVKVKSESRIRSRKYISETAFILIMLAIASAIRLIGIDHESLRLDETQSIWQATHSISFITQYMLKNVHLPLHNILLHYWILFFGSGVHTVRFLALIPGLLSIPIIYWLSSEIIGREKSKYTFLIATLSPIFVWYSREIRMYSLLVLITAASYLFFVRILKRNIFKDYFLYIAVNIIGVYTHYFFFFVIFVQILFLIISGRDLTLKNGFHSMTLKKRYINICYSLGVVLIAFLPWLIELIRNYGSGTFAPTLATPTSYNIIITYFEYVNGFLPENIGSLLLALWPLVLLFGFIFLTKRNNPFSPLLFLAVLGTIIPVLVGYTFSVTVKSIYLGRYFITVTPMLYILIAWYLTELKGRIRRIAILIFFVWMGTMLYFQESLPQNPAVENYRDAVQYIESQATPRDVVLLNPAYTIYPFQYYYSGIAKTSTLPIWDKRKGSIPEPTEERLRADVEMLRNGHKRFFLLTTNNLEGTKEVKDFLDMNYTKLDKKQFSKYIWVEVYQTEYR